MSADKQTRTRKAQKPRSDFQRLSGRFMSGLLRSLFLINQPTRYGQAGFVLPTTVLLLLVMTLTVGAMSFRTASRSQSTFLAREQEVIDNVAEPAVDRAKAKLEYLFGRDTRMPGTSTPSSDVLATLMLNVDSLGAGGLGITGLPTDPYSLPDETRIDINNNGAVDNAWSFRFDINGDGTVGNDEIIAYSVLMDDSVDPAAVDNNPATIPTPTRNDDIKLEDSGAAANVLKANNLITRNGPINTNNAISNCGGARAPAQGWLTINNAALEKNFQITAFVSNGKNPGRANSALELQQVRLAQRGNTWGAWFKYDMEIHPGENFNWNGAMHTEGSLMITKKLRAHMISSHNSCLYTQNASNVTMAQVDGDDDGVVNITTAGSSDFQGQMIAGAPTYGKFDDGENESQFHILTTLNAAPTIGTAVKTDTDSVNGATYNHLLDIAMDPVALFTQDISQHRSTGRWRRATNWETTNAFRVGGRVLNQQQTQPFLDDFYRADNRYGPRPNYAQYNWVASTDEGVGGSVNTNRGEVAYDKRLGDEIISTDPLADTLTNVTDGLDGYWERKAIFNGMRVVVGQRLELGDHLGWKFSANGRNVDASGSPTDPLYPPALNGMKNKQRQRVTLRDNLAAVQGMVVYHYGGSANGQFPLACIANTAHPGTLKTLRDSRTFNNYTGTGVVKTDFLQGQGTNGWEFSFPAAFDTEATFGAALASTEPLGIALRNLAYFAGDPNGGSPSFVPVQNATVHPFPHQAMWGDFSVLRRIFDDRLDSPTWRSGANPPQITAMADRYAALSFADKSSLHSAACTLGMLAYNIKAAEDEYAAIPNNGSAGMNALGVQLAKLMDGNTANGEIGTNPTTNLCTGSADSPGCPPVVHNSAYYAQFTAAQWIKALQNDGALGSNLSTAVQRANSILQRQQIERDRALGFMPAGTSVGTPGTGTGYVAATGTFLYSGGGPSSGRTFTVGCDPNGFARSGGNSDQAQLGLAVAFCSVAQGPKYPSLHYLFPKIAHGQTGLAPYVQPNSEEYINQPYLTNATSGVNRAVTYGVIGVPAVSFTPRASDGSNWILPTEFIGNGPLNPESMTIQIPNGGRVALSMLDKVMYNGREEMAVRVLDLDMAKLTSQKNGGGDYWISDAQNTSNGTFYAVREDAAREDAITRPASTANWTSCDTLTEVLSATCWMRPTRAVASGGPVDPPLSQRRDGSLVGISVKPVDFAPDPDRRSYGFRLNAALNGNRGDLSDRTRRTAGLTFATDNAAYIKGEFNPHTSDGTNTLEEFTQTLFNNAVAFGTPFYNSRTTSNLSNFSVNTVDRWRVAEVLADTVYLLSDNFVDGAVQEGFVRNRTEVSTDFQNIAGTNSRTSFHNQQRPLQNDGNTWGDASNWYRIDGNRGSIGGDTTIPIWVGRNGESAVFRNNTTPDKRLNDAEANADFELPNERNQSALITAATPERMNATIISGLVPSRNRQGYGGLHNFPRFLEHWNGNNLFIQGAFLQLNFSTSGTGPFDLDAWEPGDTPVDDERINYYSPPSRRWGYDVGLQFAPAGPIAERFVTVGRPRSEHYRELSIEDPYVKNLRCSKRVGGGGGRVFSSESC